ncbi:type II toxin-antitoxin system RelE/ParE family toxin [Methylocystis sp. S23]
MRALFTNEAAADLESVGDYIAEESLPQALAFVEGLRRHCETLANMPKRFPLVPRHEASGVRRMVHGNFLVFFCVSDAVVILRILHGARDYEPILFPTE